MHKLTFEEFLEENNKCWNRCIKLYDKIKQQEKIIHVLQKELRDSEYRYQRYRDHVESHIESEKELTKRKKNEFRVYRKKPTLMNKKVEEL